MQHEILTIKCYRERFGDIEVADFRIAGTPFNNAKEIAKGHLRSHVDDSNLQSAKKPRSAALVTRDGRIVALFKVRSSPNGIAVEETAEDISV